jgi:hypothetical protein
VILGAPPVFPERVAIPTDALLRERVIDVIGDIEKVVLMAVTSSMAATPTPIRLTRSKSISIA